MTPKARSQYLDQRAKQPEIGKLIDNAMDLVEVDNPSLRCIVPKIYARPNFDVRPIGALVDPIFSTRQGHPGPCYEYFLGSCASARGHEPREFPTHQSVDKLLVEMLEPMNRRVYDRCCGSGGVVVQAERFVEVHGGRRRAAAHIGARVLTPLPAAPRLMPDRAWSTAAKPAPSSPTRSATRSSWTPA